MAAPSNNFPFFPPPQRPFRPPPPPVRPPPPPVRPPPPSPDNQPTIIVIVFGSFCGFLLLAFLAAALFCFLKKKKKNVHETDIVHLDEHLKVKKAIEAGPHGSKTVALEIEGDVRKDETIIKGEKFGDGLHAKAGQGNPKTLEMGASTSGSGHHHQLEHKA